MLNLVFPFAKPPNFGEKFSVSLEINFSLRKRKLFVSCTIISLKVYIPFGPWLYSLAWWDSHASHVILATPDKRLMKSSLHSKGKRVWHNARSHYIQSHEDYLSRDAFKFVQDCVWGTSNTLITPILIESIPRLLMKLNWICFSTAVVNTQ